MKVFLLGLVIFFVASFAGAMAVAEAQNSKLKRVISLSPAITEMIFSLNLEKNLVGTSDFSDFPEAAKKIPSVGAYSHPQMEKILSLHPDLILIPAEGSEQTKVNLDRLNLKSAVIQIRTLKGIGDSAVKIAKILRQPDVGAEFKKKWDQDVEALKIHTANLPDNPASNHGQKIKTLISVQTEPLIVAGRETFLDEIVEDCGGENIFATLQGYPKVSDEAFLARSPQLILLAEHFDSKTQATEAEKTWQDRLEKFQKKAKVNILNADVTTRPGPRLLEGMKVICETLGKASMITPEAEKK